MLDGNVFVFYFQNSIQVAFDAADAYAHTFKSFHLFYKENESLDLEALKEQDHGRVFQFTPLLGLY